MKKHSIGEVILTTENWVVCIMENYETVDICKDHLPYEVFVGEKLVFEENRISLWDAYHSLAAGSPDILPFCSDN